MSNTRIEEMLFQTTTALKPERFMSDPDLLPSPNEIERARCVSLGAGNVIAGFTAGLGVFGKMLSYCGVDDELTAEEQNAAGWMLSTISECMNGCLIAKADADLVLERATITK